MSRQVNIWARWGRAAAWLALGLGMPTSVHASIYIGSDASPQLNVNSNYTVAGTVSVGRTDVGELIVDGGHTLTSTAGNMGSTVNGLGVGTVSATNSKWVVSSSLDVAVYGAATLDIYSGGRVQVAGNLTIGVNQDSNGSISLYAVSPGAGGQLAVTGALDIGRNGYGTLESSGASTITSGSARLSYAEAGVGRAILSGASTWTNAGLLTLGYSGTAEIDLSAGAAMTTGSMQSAYEGTGVGQLNISSADFTCTNKAELGMTGTTQITVAGGNLTVGNLELGQSGQGFVAATASGRLLIPSAQLGIGAGSSGDISLADEGTAWTNGGTVVVGVAGYGAVNVADGADLAITNLTLGQTGDGAGVIAVSGNGSTATFNSAYVGYAGNGWIFVEAGGVLTTLGQVSVYSVMGTSPDATSDVTITGSGSRWHCNGPLRIGAISGSTALGLGKVVIEDQGRMDATQPITVEALGDLQVSNGTLNAASLTNLGTLTHSQGTISAGAIDGSTGVIFVAGGTLTADRIRQTRLSIANAESAVGRVQIRANGSSSGVSTLNQLDFAGSTGAWQGKLDLMDNDLVIFASAGTAATVLAQTTDRIRTARNSPLGLWQGEGITTSVATSLTGLAVILNNNGSGQVIHQTFEGVAVNVNSILVKFTYIGDANLNGAIDSDDYFRIDSGFLGGPASYARGDFNYDGMVNIDDYFLIDRSYARQQFALIGDANLNGVIDADDYFRIDAGFVGGPVSYSRGDFNRDGVINIDDYFLIDRSYAIQTGPLGLQPIAVPEPACLLLLVAGGLALGRRRRTRAFPRPTETGL